MNNRTRGPVRSRWAAGLIAAATFCAMAQNDEPRPAIHAPLAPEALVLDLVEVDQRVLAVGERGHVLISDDGGRSWRQAEHVPVQATLVRIVHAEGRLWAVGHDTTIITSTDAGENWELQHFEPDWEQPLLDVHFFNAEEGIAIGAYGLYMITDDGGRTWIAENMADRMTSEGIDWEEVARRADEFGIGLDADDEMYYEEAPDRAEEDEYYDAAMDFDRGCYEFMECHLNKLLALSPDRLMIAAERGYGFRSTDGGENWESFSFPYPGSMFGLEPLGECMVAFGLRGNVQKSCDFGDSWEIIDTGIPHTLMGGSRAPDGSVVMVGAAAARVRLRPDSSFEVTTERLGSDYAMVLPAVAGGMIIGGEDGVRRDE